MSVQWVWKPHGVGLVSVVLPRDTQLSVEPLRRALQPGGVLEQAVDRHEQERGKGDSRPPSLHPGTTLSPLDQPLLQFSINW